MNDLLGSGRTCNHGIRLQKLEVYNWGTFDSMRGQVHVVRPEGQTTLLIGQNGSGKSTLVDGLLTLLVRPVVRNYNVAAGAHKQERDERTYIKGAFGRFSRDEDNRADIQYLRPNGLHYSALLACFRNDQTRESFTLAQVLYLNSEGRSEKIYCFSPGERSIAEDCARLTSMDKVRQQLEQRGFRATTRYNEYHSWFAKATGVRSKAMDMFNQTVAVKDIQSLNRFIRDHMLEGKPWDERVDSLLNHFTQLSEAHQSLVRVRRQFDLLEPIADKGLAYRGEAQRLAQTLRLLDASDSFFRHKTVELLTPACDDRRRQLVAIQMRKEELDRQILVARDECRRLKNEIEQAGGERLRQIPLLIENHATQARSKHEANQRFHTALIAAGVRESATDAASFAAIRQRLAPILEQLERDISIAEQQRVDFAIKQRELVNILQEDERELEALNRRQGNLPESAAELRRRICADLRLTEKDLPFAAELIAVNKDQRVWEASIEMVLRPFSLSLLVPQRHYRLVSAYVDRTRLADARNRGQRLVYLRIGERSTTTARPVHPQSLLRKLDLREGHPLLPWVKCELEERFDFRCCETIEEFQSAHDLALTRERHVKIRDVRHEKDDRERVTDPRQFVLGWDNREKRQWLAQQIALRRDELARLEEQGQQLDHELDRCRDRRSAVRQAQECSDFAAIDYARHEREIEALELERRTLEEKSDAIRLLKQRLGEAESLEKAVQASRDETIGTERQLKTQIEDGERLIANARHKLDVRTKDGTLTQHTATFPELEVVFERQPMTAATLFDREREIKDDLHAQESRLRMAVEPLRNDLCTAMNRFLREFPEEQDDLDACVDSLDSFLGLREHIQREDLPRHEQRFKERLNEKVIQEIGLLNGALQSESTEIRTKIDVLNQSLRKLEYRPGTYMRLEPRPVRDREISEFQDALKECLAGTFEGTLAADEARYLRIEKLINRLREEQRWREKVTDVRRWFDFAARELDEATGAECGYYEDSTGQSGGEKAKLAFTILVAAIAYQYDIDPNQPSSNRFHFVVVDEMFSKVDDQYAEYALELFEKFGLQLMIVAPLDAKARVTEPYVGCYLHVVKDAQTNHSEIFSMTVREFDEAVALVGDNGNGREVSHERARPAAPR